MDYDYGKSFNDIQRLDIFKLWRYFIISVSGRQALLVVHHVIARALAQKLFLSKVSKPNTLSEHFIRYLFNLFFILIGLLLL